MSFLPRMEPELRSVYTYLNKQKLEYDRFSYCGFDILMFVVNMQKNLMQLCKLYYSLYDYIRDIQLSIPAAIAGEAMNGGTTQAISQAVGRVHPTIALYLRSFIHQTH